MPNAEWPEKLSTTRLAGVQLGKDSPLRDTPRQKRRHTHVEAPIQGAVAELYQGIGCTVYQNSVFGAKPVGVTPGVPDLRIKHPEWRLDFDHEVKAPDGRQSQEQYAYLLEAQRMGSIYVLGGTEYAIAFLAFLGLGMPVGDTIRFVARERWRHVLIERWDTGRDAYVFMATQWYASPAFAASLERYGYRAPTGRKRSVRPRVG